VKVYDCRLPAERDLGVAAAVAAVQRGDLVVLPTDTLYGLGCDAFKKQAVSAVLRAKGRGRDMPIPVLIGSRRTLDGLAHRLPASVRELAEAFWPGGLTIIIEHARSLDWDLGDSGGTVAVRMPLHPVALEVLRETGPMAVSSANKHGRPPATTAAQAREQLGYSVKIYLDGGPCADPVPSTIVDVTGEVPQLLRVGAVGADRLREVLPDLAVPDPPHPQEPGTPPAGEQEPGTPPAGEQEPGLPPAGEPG
jgi:tRNA threonylcarbamoyl adenosine modification protein (Sua5/YciO/YrdC/YwlC family)